MLEREIKRAVITGPTGAIGNALCRTLLKNNVTVYAVCRPNSPRIASLTPHKNLQIVACDAKDLQHLPALLPGGADVFYHFAWAHTIGAGRNDMSAQIQNIEYTINAVRAASALGCAVFVGAGSQAEYGRVEGVLKPDTPCFPENGYGMAKLCAGQMSRVECRALGLAHIWTRILSVYGPGDGPNTMISGVIRQLQQRTEPALTEGRQKWDYLYSDDAAEALYLLAKHGVDQKVYVLGSGEAAPLREYVCALRDAIDPQLPLGFGKLPYSALQVMHLQADISALQSDTGFVPQTCFAEGIRKTIESMKEDVG